MVLTERDRALLGYLGVARFATAPHVHRLIAPGHDKAIASRRLARLSERGPNPGDDPYLRRIEYRRSDALPFPVWTLAPRGRAIAEEAAPGPVAGAEPAVGVRFVERVLALDEVLLGLVLALRRSESASLRDLPFRWRASGEPIRFETYDRQAARSQPALLRPDAILELIAPGGQRRFFLELESGLLGLEPGERRTAHVERRIDRYATFFTGFARDSDRTWYEAAFPDRLRPELVLLVHSPSRLDQVERLIAERARRAELRFGLRAFTVERAAEALAAAAGPGTTPASAAEGGRVVRIDPDLARQLGDGLDLFIKSIRTLQASAAKHLEQCPKFYLPPIPADDLNAFCRRLRHDVLGIPRPSGAKP
jgi:hypothetical protein